MIRRSFLGLPILGAESGSAPGGARVTIGWRGSPGLLTLAAELAP